MRRRAVLERLEEEAELGLRLLLRKAQGVEERLLDLGVVDPDRSSADLVAVQDQVVRPRADLPQVLPVLEHFGVFRVRTRERMVHRHVAFFRFVPTEERKVENPGEGVVLLRFEAELLDTDRG